MVENYSALRWLADRDMAKAIPLASTNCVRAVCGCLRSCRTVLLIFARAITIGGRGPLRDAEVLEAGLRLEIGDTSEAHLSVADASLSAS